MELFLVTVSYGLVLTFGVLVTCAFADLPRTRFTRLSIAVFILAAAVGQNVCYSLFGMEVTAKLYPFITHLPLVFFLVVFHKRSWAMAFACVFSAYLCCQTNRWFGTLATALVGSVTFTYWVKILTVFPLLHLLITYVAKPVHKLMRTSTRALLLSALLPFTYYIFDYVTGVYSSMLYAGKQVAVEFMPSIMSICYFVFIMLYSGEMQRRLESEREQMMLSMQTRQSIRDIESLRESEKLSVIYRHDLRHHLMLLSAMADEKNVDKLKEYIHSVQQGINHVTPARYCENEIVNLILGAFIGRAQQENIGLVLEVRYPPALHLEDVALCTLFSNALENALIATAAYTGTMTKTVRVEGRMYGSKLLLMVENPYSGAVVMENGVPQNNAPGHGSGVKSIISVTEQYGGLWSFTADNGLFTLKVAI